MTANPSPTGPPLPEPAGSPASQGSRARENPYVGPRALREGERIFGRDRELRELLNRMIADRMVLLYSPSGAGKSSLVQAGLVPQMRQEKFAVLPTVRVGLEPPVEHAGDGEAGEFNRYIFSALLALEQDLSPEQQQDPSEIGGLSFKDYLARRPRQPDELSSRLLIFDQFEEILTHAPLDREGKLAFFEQVGEALLDHDLWALFVIREDFLAGLDPYLPLIPTYLRSTFRLDLLESQPAWLAIQKPVDSQGITFENEAAQKLVDDLRRVWVQQPDGSQREELGLYVEPVQLQVVCRRLYKELKLDLDLDKTKITGADIARLGDVDQALGEYYSAELSEIAERKSLAERDIRDWFGEHLITENLLRGQVLMGEGASSGMANEVIRLLEDAHLVRAESRRNATWFELAHDRLVRPVLEDNQAWARQHLQEFQRQAAEWRKKNRTPDLLLRGRDLLKAEEWERAHPADLNAIDRELLEASRERRARHLSPAQRKASEWEQQGRPKGLLLNETELAQAETWLIDHPDETQPLEMEYINASRVAVAEEARSRQERELQLVYERQRAKDQELQNQKLRRRNLWLAALAILATVVFLVALYFAYQFNTLASQNAARATEGAEIAAMNARQRDINATEAANNAAESMLNSQIAAKANHDSFLLRETSKAQEATAVALATQAEENFQGRATAEFNASLAQAGQLAILARENAGKNTPLSALLGIAAYQRFPQDWDKRNVLLTSLRINVQQQVRTNRAPIETQNRYVQNLAFSQDGKLLAWSGLDGELRVWDLNQNQLLRRLQIFPDHGVNSLAFNPQDSNLLVGGSGNGFLTFWNLQTGEGESVEAIFIAPDRLRYTAGMVLSLAFSPDGEQLAVAGVNGNVQIWDVAQRQPVSIIDTRSVTVRKLDWSPSGNRLAGAAYDSRGGRRVGVVYIWDPNDESQVEPIYSEEDELVYTLDWSSNGDWLAFGGGGLNNPFYPRKIILYDPNTRQQLDITAQDYNIRTLAFDQNSEILAAGSDDGTVRFWDISQAGANGTVEPVELPISDFITRPPVQGLAFSPQGLNRLAYFTSDSRRIAIVEFGVDNSLNTMLKPDTIRQFVRVFPNLTCDLEMNLIAEPVSGLLAIGRGSSGELLSLTQQGSTLLVASTQSDFRASVGSGRLLIAAHGPDSLVATGDVTGKIQVWDTQTGAVVWSTETNLPVVSLAFSRNGERLAASFADAWCESSDQQRYTIQVYETGAEQPVVEFQSGSVIHSLAFSEDGAFLAGGDVEGSIQLWDLQTQAPSGSTFDWPQAGTITALAISSDGSTLASGNHLGDIAFWDIASRRQIGNNVRVEKPAGSAPVTGLLFAPDGLSLVSATQDGGLQRWDLDPQSWIKRLCELAGRDFTPQELQDYPVTPVCAAYFQQSTSTPTPNPGP